MPGHCQCEHKSHNHNGTVGAADRTLTPDGNFGHRYTVTFLALVRVPTIYGTLDVCAECAQDCLHPRHGFRKGESQ